MKLFKHLKREYRRIKSRFIRFNHHSRITLRNIGIILGILAVIASFVALADLTVRFGFEHDSNTFRWLDKTLRIVQITFIANVAYNLIFNFRETRETTRPVKWISDISVLITLLPLAYPNPANPWIPWLSSLLYSRFFLFAILTVYSILTISKALLQTLNKRTNPSLILAISFMFLIFTGALMMMMPKCNTGDLSFSDSLFLSTSAVCITGLTTVDISTTLTPYGLTILAFLIQTGGLGVMTFTSFFALFYTGNASIYSQIMVKDMIYTRSMNSLLPTLLYILVFTVIIEIIGAVFIFFSIRGILYESTTDEIVFSLFHSMSAFCNAGFSNLEGGLSNPGLMNSNQSIYLIISVLVFAGGLGFPVLVNLKDAILYHLRNFFNRITLRKRQHQLSYLYSMNTRVALATTTIILIVSIMLFLIFETNNTLAGMTVKDKIIQAIFNSLSPRSSGFTSVNPAGFLNITIILTLILMWIGGGSQSTAGGIKVNTFATMLLNLRGIITGKKRVTICSRTISTGSLRRANAIIAVSIISFSTYTMILLALEPDLPAKSLIFESASALFTVGSSLGITPELGTVSKYLLCSSMFLGRVGLLSLMSGLFARERANEPIYPTDNIIIN